ncbi:hypothetical protein RFI_17360, partial [Reticulomyxa filosa]
MIVNFKKKNCTLFVLLLQTTVYWASGKKLMCKYCFGNATTFYVSFFYYLKEFVINGITNKIFTNKKIFFFFFALIIKVQNEKEEIKLNITGETKSHTTEQNHVSLSKHESEKHVTQSIVITNTMSTMPAVQSKQALQTELYLFVSYFFFFFFFKRKKKKREIHKTYKHHIHIYIFIQFGCVLCVCVCVCVYRSQRFSVDATGAGITTTSSKNKQLANGLEKKRHSFVPDLNQLEQERKERIDREKALRRKMMNEKIEELTIINTTIATLPQQWQPLQLLLPIVII